MHVLPLEITDRESVRDAVRAVGEIVGERGLDYLVNNAAIVRPPLPLSLFIWERESVELTERAHGPGQNVEE